MVYYGDDFKDNTHVTFIKGWGIFIKKFVNRVHSAHYSQT